MRWLWPLVFFTPIGCADETDRVTPLLAAEAGPVDGGGDGGLTDVQAGPRPPVMGTFTLSGAEGSPLAAVLLRRGAATSQTDHEGRAQLPVPAESPFSLVVTPTDGPVHWVEGVAPADAFSHGVIVLSDDRLAALFAAAATRPVDGGGVLMVEAPAGATVHAEGGEGVVTGPDGPTQGEVVPSEGPRHVLFLSMPAGETTVIVQSADHRTCFPLPAGAGELRPRVRPEGVTHVAFRCP